MKLRRLSPPLRGSGFLHLRVGSNPPSMCLGNANKTLSDAVRCSLSCSRVDLRNSLQPNNFVPIRDIHIYSLEFIREKHPVVRDKIPCLLQFQSFSD